jgi:hypothetical protein
MIFKEIITVYCNNHIKYITKLCGENPELLNLTGDDIYLFHFMTQPLVSISQTYYSVFLWGGAHHPVPYLKLIIYTALDFVF